MAKEKQTPRQKMINLMYLVFIAMMALNIDAEIIRSYYDSTRALNETRTFNRKKEREDFLKERWKLKPSKFRIPMHSLGLSTKY